VRLFTPSDGPLWLRRFSDSILGAFKQVMDAPFRLWTSTTADLPAVGDYTGGLAWNADVSRVTYSDGAAWRQVQPWDPTLAALAAYNANGLLAQTATDMFAGRTLQAPAAGLAIANPAGIAGDPTFALANDLAALEALSGTNTLYYRSGADAWSPVTVGPNLGFSGGTLGSALGTAATLASDADGTLAANSDGRAATQKATKTYIDNAVTGLLDFKGGTNCSANPNYPAAFKGDAYAVSAAGRIGGASGVAVDVGDVFVASADNAGGTQAAVGSSWFVLEHNLAGALLAANNLSDLASAATARSNLGLGTAATQSTGTSGGTVPLLNGANTHSGQANFTGGIRESGTHTARCENTGAAGAPAGATGQGIEFVGANLGNSIVQAYNRSTSAYAPLVLDGSSVSIRPGATAVVLFSGAGAAFGTLTSTSTASPIAIDLGGTFSNAAGANPKLKLYNDGTAFYGIGVSLNQLDYIGANNASGHVFYHGAFKSASIEQISGRSGGAFKLYGTSPAINLDTSAGVAGIITDVNAGVTAIGGNYLAITVPAGKAISLVVNNAAIVDVTGTGVAIVSGTTASAANLFQSASGTQLLRSTSSMRFKQDARPLSDGEADRLLLLDPFTYRSRCAADDRRRRHWGVSAEQAAAVGLGKLVHREADGRPAGFMYERAVAGLLQIARRERAARIALETRMAAAERALAGRGAGVARAGRS
jgi:hypothetical protein